MLNIEIWSDYTCPYCYIGKVQLLQVLKAMNITDVTFTHRVFLLDAGKESHPERTFLEGLHLPSEQESVMSKKLVQIEALAENIASEILNRFDIAYSVMVRIRKKEAPVKGIFDYMGVVIRRYLNEQGLS